MQKEKDEFEKMAEEIQINYSVGRVSAEDSLTCCEITAIADALRTVHNNAVEKCANNAYKNTGHEYVYSEIRKLKKDKK